jgi:hypothetical protein
VSDPSWKMIPKVLSHVEVGGCTDGQWSIYYYSKSQMSFEMTAGSAAFRDLSSVLDPKVNGIPCSAPGENLDASRRPEVIQLRPNVYHGGGLIPWVARSSFIVSPSIYSPTRWVRRRLTNQEMSSVLDYSSEMFKGLTQNQWSSIVKDTGTIPQKVLLKALDILDFGIWGHEALAGASVTATTDVLVSVVETTGKNAEDSATRNNKAAKNDDAPVPEYLWDDVIVPDGNDDKIAALSVIRTFALRWWRKNTTREFLIWLKVKHNACKLTVDYRNDVTAGRDCISRCCNASWWEWDAGSRPLFWRWPSDYRLVIRDGLPPWIKGPMPSYRVPQRAERNPQLKSIVKSKLSKVRSKGYIVPGNILSLTSFFTVPKGEGDVRMVYDATKSGLNSQLWAPWFMLPTIESHLRCVQPGSFMGDIDFSEQFLNFILHKKVRPYAGVDLTSFFPEELNKDNNVLWEGWGRCGMGFVSSPYTAVQGTLIAEEIITGDPQDPTNVFRWDRVILNLPGSSMYKPADPWVYKARVNLIDNTVAITNDLKIYVDDVRTIGSSYAECRKSSRTVASKAGFLGLQDAARKRRDPSQTPGPWAGSIVVTTASSVYVTISLERRIKAKGMIQWIHEACKLGNDIDFKTLESYRGFLIYIARTYPTITPFLKGIHLTLDSWRPWRDEDSWKLSMSDIRNALAQKGHEVECLNSGSKPPSRVKIATRLKDDIEALQSLFDLDQPPLRQVRPCLLSWNMIQPGMFVILKVMKNS